MSRKKLPKPPSIVAKDPGLKLAWQAACQIEDESARSEAFAGIASFLVVYEDARGIIWADKLIDRLVTSPVARCRAFVELSGARRDFREGQERERESKAHAKRLGLTH